MERDYAELIKALRFAFDQPCYSCVLGEKCNWGDFCFFKRSADAIEELIKTSRRWELEAAANEKDKQYLVDENRRLVDSLMNLLVQKWISVEERLPRKYEEVITVDKHGHVQWNYLINEKHLTWSTGYHITHWMPLPAAPKEVQKDELA